MWLVEMISDSNLVIRRDGIFLISGQQRDTDLNEFR
jgi:hypothetical protein